MAALARRVVKVTVLTAGVVPVMGLAATVSAASRDGGLEEGKGKFIRACDLPMYEVSNTKNSKDDSVEYEPNILEKQITEVRKSVAGFLENFQEMFDSIKTSYDTGIEHSKATLNFVQTNPGELPRVGFISVATMGGFVLGYRGSIMRKAIFAGIAAGSAAALCYPTATVDLAQNFADETKTLWKSNIGWPFEDTPTLEKVSYQRGIRPKELKGDPGQSKAEDKDMYSKR